VINVGAAERQDKFNLFKNAEKYREIQQHKEVRESIGVRSTCCGWQAEKVFNNSRHSLPIIIRIYQQLKRILILT